MADLNPAASILLAEIAEWEVNSGCTASDLGRMVRNHPGFVPLLRKRGTLTRATATLFRNFMRAFPSREELTPQTLDVLKREAMSDKPWDASRHLSLSRKYGLGWKPLDPLSSLSRSEFASATEIKSKAPLAPPPPAPPAPALPTVRQPEPSSFRKPSIPAHVVEAAKLDGRDLTSFVSALIEMGFDCWREDRALEGEAVA
jgi:hypothetical protein